jgi:hypothetical protein
MVASLEKDFLESTEWLANALPNPFIVSEDSDRTSGPDEDLIFALAINEALDPKPPAITVNSVVADLHQLSASQPVTRRPLRGIGLIGAVFDELSAQLGKEFSTAELMRAAQTLIDISKAEFVANPYKDPVDRAGYFSWDLVRAFDHAWHVTEVETKRIEHCEDELSSETLDCARQLQHGWQEALWEF